MGLFGPKGARLVFSCVSAVGATKFAPQADWDLQHSADALTTTELQSRSLAPAGHPCESLEKTDMKRKGKINFNDIQVPVFYATNRQALSSSERQKHPRRFFGQVKKTTPGLSFGLGRVRIKEDAFKLANLQDERSARKLEEIAPCKDEAEWKRKLREALSGDLKKSIIVFVHGCFTDFPRGLEYGGLVKHGCHFSGPMVVFSWPSIGHKVQNRPYARDEASVKGTVPHLKEFLLMLLTEFEAKVHVLSYSMGARAVIGALDLIEEEVLALDGKLKKETGELKAALQDTLKNVVARGEKAAADVRVGVRELGDILARERDLLNVRVASSRGSTSVVLTTASPAKPVDARLGQAENVAGTAVPSDFEHRAENKFDLAASNAACSTQDDATCREESGLALQDDEEQQARLRRWEALRSKLGHLIFMAPDEEVDKFRHTARQWTRGLRDRVSGRVTCSQAEASGASEAVKERVKSGLEAEGPEAVEGAAMLGQKQVLDGESHVPDASSSEIRNQEEGAAAEPVPLIALTAAGLSDRPVVFERERKIGGLAVMMQGSLHLDTIYSGKALDADSCMSGKQETTQSGEPTDAAKSPKAAASVSEGALRPLVPRTLSSPLILPTAYEHQPSIDPAPSPDDDIFPLQPFSGPPAGFGAPSPASSTSSRTPSRSSSSTDLVGEELQQALLWEHLQACGSEQSSDRSSEASSRASSRPPSRTSSLLDLGSASSSFSEGTEDLAMTAGGIPMTAGKQREGWRKRCLPGLGIHLSSSAPVLNTSLQRRFSEAALPRQLLNNAPPSPHPFSQEDSELRGPRFSLYTSQSDWALKLAGLATTKPWARGLARMVAMGDPGKNDLGRRVGATLLVEEGYETIDATEVSIGSRNMGHHYLFHRCILEDITHLLSGANAHKRRFEALTAEGHVYWRIERGDFKATQSLPTTQSAPTWATVTADHSKEPAFVLAVRDNLAIHF